MKFLDDFSMYCKRMILFLAPIPVLYAIVLIVFTQEAPIENKIAQIALMICSFVGYARYLVEGFRAWWKKVY